MHDDDEDDLPVMSECRENYSVSGDDDGDVVFLKQNQLDVKQKRIAEMGMPLESLRHTPPHHRRSQSRARLQTISPRRSWPRNKPPFSPMTLPGI